MAFLNILFLGFLWFAALVSFGTACFFCLMVVLGRSEPKAAPSRRTLQGLVSILLISGIMILVVALVWTVPMIVVGLWLAALAMSAAGGVATYLFRQNNA